MNFLYVTILKTMEISIRFILFKLGGRSNALTDNT